MRRALFPANFGGVCLQAFDCNPRLLLKECWVLLACKFHQQLLWQTQDDVWATARELLDGFLDVTPAADGCTPARWSKQGQSQMRCRRMRWCLGNF
jgi:hypothetical protein